MALYWIARVQGHLAVIGMEREDALEVVRLAIMLARPARAL